MDASLLKDGAIHIWHELHVLIRTCEIIHSKARTLSLVGGRLDHTMYSWLYHSSREELKRVASIYHLFKILRSGFRVNGIEINITMALSMCFTQRHCPSV